MENNDNKGGLSLELNAEVARGTYSNLAIISHSHSEFIVDFATILPGMPKPDITNRIVMTPENAKRLAFALQDNLIKYEHEFGAIELEEPKKPEGSDTFDLGSMGPLGGNNLS